MKIFQPRKENPRKTILGPRKNSSQNHHCKLLETREVHRDNSTNFRDPTPWSQIHDTEIPYPTPPTSNRPGRTHGTTQTRPQDEGERGLTLPDDPPNTKDHNPARPDEHYPLPAHRSNRAGVTLVASTSPSSCRGIDVSLLLTTKDRQGHIGEQAATTAHGVPDNDDRGPAHRSTSATGPRSALRTAQSRCNTTSTRWNSFTSV